MSIKIIAGQYKGRLLEVPAVSRPTLARARQVVFDILYSLIPGGVGDKIVLDCFAGSGAMALEALSRGASYAYLMDKDHTAIGVMHDNIKKLGITNASIMRVDLQKRIYKNKERAVDIVFLDPPYGKVDISLVLSNLKKCGWIDEATFIVVEYNEDYWSDSYEIIAKRKVGLATFCFLHI